MGELIIIIQVIVEMEMMSMSRILKLMIEEIIMINQNLNQDPIQEEEKLK